MFPSQVQILAPGFTPGGVTRGRGLRFSGAHIGRAIPVGLLWPRIENGI